jgi:thioredoxin reductase
MVCCKRFAGAKVLHEEVRREIRHLFLFIGADPNTDWLAGSSVALDAKGFVLTGMDAGELPAAVYDASRRVCHW